jgi:hypothetical protein
MLVAPYRLFVHNEGEQVLYQSQMCYRVGQKGNETALFCPQDPRNEWNKVVNLKDPDLIRTGKKESIFSAFSESELKSQRTP